MASLSRECEIFSMISGTAARRASTASALMEMSEEAAVAAVAPVEEADGGEDDRPWG